MSTGELPPTLAIIPARGGSKGIPRKNLALLAGRPLLAYTVEAAQRTAAVERVVVSTDDPEIAAAAADFGAEVVWRPVGLSGDEASSESALSHALDELRARDGYEPGLVAFLQATSPLRRKRDLQVAIETLVAEDADSLFTACAVHGFVWRRSPEGLAPVTYDHRKRPRRQELGAVDLLENGSIYLFKPWVLRELGNRLGGKVAVSEMEPLDSYQVDEPEDLVRMERLLQARGAAVPGVVEAVPPPPTGATVAMLAAVRLLVLDFDGVMTDDRVLVHQDGSEAVLCHRGDGLGIERLGAAGVEVMVLSKERNPVVGARCQKLGIGCHQGQDDKLPLLRGLAAARGLTAAEIAFVGNDVNDLECLAWAGVSFAVADARPEALAAAGYRTNRPGGQGAVREVCELLLEARRDR